MNDCVDKDDEKFIELYTKQRYQDCRHLEPNTLIEKEDDKMEDLMFLQSVCEKEEPKSIEEKYEHQLILDEVSREIDKMLIGQGFKEVAEFSPEGKE